MLKTKHFNTVLGYRIDMYVPKYKLTIEVDELGDCTRDLKAEIKRQQKIEKELNCKFIRIDPSREHFNMADEYSRIRDYMIESTNKATKEATRKETRKEGIDEISDRLLNLKLKKNQFNENQTFKMDC